MTPEQKKKGETTTTKRGWTRKRKLNPVKPDGLPLESNGSHVRTGRNRLIGPNRFTANGNRRRRRRPSRYSTAAAAAAADDDDDGSQWQRRSPKPRPRPLPLEVGPLHLHLADQHRNPVRKTR